VIFGIGKFRSAHAFGWKKFQAWLQKHCYFLKQNANPVAFLIGVFSSDIAQFGTLKYKSLIA
jgi:hypothetical protein